jgi:hypothetical protein
MSEHIYARTYSNGLWSARPSNLAAETRVALPDKAVAVRASDTVVTVSCSPDLTAGEVATLDGVVASHTGESVPTPKYEVRGSAPIVTGVAAILSVGYTETGGTTADPRAALRKPLDEAHGLVVGTYRAIGSGALLKLTQNDLDISAEFALTDTANVWTTFVFGTNAALAASRNIYALQAKLGGATLAEIKFVSLVLREPM